MAHSHRAEPGPGPLPLNQDCSRFRQEVGGTIAGRTWLAEQRRTAAETPRRGR